MSNNSNPCKEAYIQGFTDCQSRPSSNGSSYKIRECYDRSSSDPMQLGIVGKSQHRGEYWPLMRHCQPYEALKWGML